MVESTTAPASSSTVPSCSQTDVLTRRLILCFTCFVLIVVLVLCVFKLVVIYCRYKRRRAEFIARNEFLQRTQQETEEIGHPFSYLAHAGFPNCGFSEPPPRYDQLFKDETVQPPPVYEQPTAATSTNMQHPTVQRSQSVLDQPIITNIPHRTDLQSLPTETPVSRQICITGGVRSSIGSSNGNLPDGAFGTFVPPVVLRTQEEDIRIRSATDLSSYGSPSMP